MATAHQKRKAAGTLPQKKSRATKRPAKDGTRRGRNPGVKNKPKALASEDLLEVLEKMVEKVIERRFPTKSPMEARKAEPPTKLAPKVRMSGGAQRARLLYERPMSILDIPNPNPEKHYYWISTNPFEQQRLLLEGFEFVIGEDACRDLGFDPQIYLNSRHRIGLFDVELAWMPMEVAKARRAHFSGKTRDHIQDTTEGFKRVAERFGKVTESMRLGREEVTRKGELFDAAEQE